MKRVIIAITLAAAFAASVFTASAKPRSVGIGLGAYQNISMQHMIYGTDRFFQLDLGYHVGVRQYGMAYTGDQGTLRLMATYNIPIMSFDWTSEGTWNFYAGPGFTLASDFSSDKAISIGVVAQAGIEYLFDDIPLQLSADVRPFAGLIISNDRFMYDLDGFMGFIPTISARYWF